MEDLVIIESKDYAQVIFDDVDNCYMENHPVECSFSFNELLTPANTDSIGIFKIGFQLYKDHVCIEQVNLDSIQDRKGKITFAAEKVPKDDGEFYQFIYLSQSKQVRGASIPFQFKRPHLSDYVEVEEEDESVLLKSKESALNETINDIKKRCEHLTEANNMYEKLVRENEELLSVLKEEVSTVKLRCLRLTMDNEKLNMTVNAKAENLKNLADTITNLSEENGRLQSRFADLSNENKNLVDSLQHRITQVTELKNDLDAIKHSKEQLEAILNIKECELHQLRQDKMELTRLADDLICIREHIEQLEKQMNDRADELVKIKNDLKKNENLVSQQAETIKNILNERDQLNGIIQKLIKEKNELECAQENLNQELNISKDKHMAAEQSKELLRSQFFATTNELNEANAKIDEYLDSIKQYASKEKQLELEKQQLMEKMQQMQADYESKLEQANGSYYALKLAHVHMESRMKANDGSRDKHESEMNEQKQTIQKLSRENEELRERISEGAKEYSKLFEKYRQVRSKQFSSEMSHLNELTSEIAQLRHENSQSNQQLHQQQPVQLKQPFRNSQSEPDHDHDVSDSAYQDKTLSNCVRTTSSSADIENTLLDALLGSSLYQNGNNGSNNNNNWSETSKKSHLPNDSSSAASVTSQQLAELKQQFTQLTTTSTPISSATTSGQLDATTTRQPKVTSLFPNHTSNNVLYASNDLAAYEEISRRNMNSKVFGSTYSERQLNLRSPSYSSSTSSLASSITTPTTVPTTSNGNESISSATTESRNGYMAHKIDLNSLESRNCDICGHLFSADSGLNDIQNHYTIHYGPSCPICFLTFRKGYPQSEYENHVNSHFPN